jgi:hypothetical protein
MIRKILIVFLVGCATVQALAGTIPREIQSRYVKLHSVIRHVNFKQYKTFFAEDFLSVDPAGKSASRTEFLDGIKPLFGSSTSATLTEKFLDSKKHDGLFDVRTDLLVKLKGNAGITVVHELCTDTWKKVGSKWLLVKTVVTKFDVMMPKPKKSSRAG